jgi:uncharacterized protein
MDEEDYGEWEPRAPTALWIASKGGNFIDVCRLLAVCTKNINDGANENDTTPLFEAVEGDHQAIVELLLAAGADVKEETMEGKHPMHCVRSVDVAKLLIHGGADISVADDSGSTPLHCAAFLGDETLVMFMIKNGADVMTKDGNGDTAIHLLMLNGDDEDDLLEILRYSGVTGSSSGCNGNTLLHIAAGYNLEETVEFFLKNVGADIMNIKNNVGNTPLHIAADQNRNGVIKILLDNGADVKSTNDLGETPLHLAVFEDDIDAVQILLDAGADESCETIVGDTPWDYAARYNKGNVCDQLEDAADTRILKSEAFAMGLHERLGVGSHVKWLDPEILRMILQKTVDQA